MFFKRSLVTLCAAMAVSMSAQAAFQFELKEVGPDVVLTGSGSFNIAGLTPRTGFTNGGGFLGPNFPLLQVGASGAPMDVYSVAAVGASTFGTFGFVAAGVATGDAIAFASDLNHVFGPNDWRLSVPAGYISGTQLSGSATFTGRSFASLGITPGTYTWSWGSSIATGDSVTLNAVSAVPEPSSVAMALAGLGVLGVWARRQKRISQRPAEAAAA